MINWHLLKSATVNVYKMDGGYWFTGTLVKVEGDVLTIEDDETGEAREVNATKNKVRLE